MFDNMRLRENFVSRILLPLILIVTSCQSATEDYKLSEHSSARIANYDLACWNLKSSYGSHPQMIFTATSDSKVTNIKFNRDRFTEYLPAKVNGVFVGKLNDSNHSPYKGTLDYLMPGMRLILPANLDPKSLETIVINDTPRQNAVLTISPEVYDPQGHASGDIYIRLHCVSKLRNY